MNKREQAPLRELLDYAQERLDVMRQENNPNYEIDQSSHYWLDLALREGLGHAITQFVSYFN